MPSPGPADLMLRIGVLGAAAINRAALLKPAGKRTDVEVAAIAARDPRRASAHGAKHGIATVHDTYQDLLDDPSLDAVYIPLPPSLHARWGVAALEAGKHVLIEKPFANSAAEARLVQAAARGATTESGAPLVAMEGFHWRHHPMAQRMVDIVQRGDIGAITDVSGSFRAFIPKLDGLRWNGPMGGGALADLGCYVMHQVRTITGEEPEVVSATMTMARGVDRVTTASLRFPSGTTGSLACSIASLRPFSGWLRITGTDGAILAFLPVLGHLGFLRVTSHGATRSIRDWTGTTYDHQLEAFHRATVHGEATPTDVTDAVANMAALDRVRIAAGHPPKPS